MATREARSDSGGTSARLWGKGFAPQLSSCWIRKCAHSRQSWSGQAVSWAVSHPPETLPMLGMGAMSALEQASVVTVRHLKP